MTSHQPPRHGGEAAPKEDRMNHEPLTIKDQPASVQILASQLMADLRIAEIRSRLKAAGAKAAPRAGKEALAVQLAVAMTEPADAAEPEPERPRLAKLTVEELQVRHLELIGRATKSRHVGYLRWRCRQAERGLVRTGPIERASREPGEFKVVPLRLTVDAAQAIDDVRQRQGLRSRTELIRRAVAAWLEGVGEDEAAAVVGQG